MLDGRNTDAVAQIERGAEGRAADARKVDGDGLSHPALTEITTNHETGIGGCGAESQTDRRGRMHAIAGKRDFTGKRALACGHLFHTLNYSTPQGLTLAQLLAKKNSARKLRRVTFSELY
jgi:hypothetical protein